MRPELEVADIFRRHGPAIRSARRGSPPTLLNGCTLEHAQAMAAHESARTTKLYDRTRERLTREEVERIRL
jgi:hypothetical protein